MVSADAARTAVGVLGNAIALFLFLSPMPTFIRIWKKGSVEQYSPVPYLATLINCIVWVLYGLPMVHPHSTLVVTINGAGTLIEVVYILLFLLYSDRQKRLRVAAVVLIELVFISALAALVLTLVHTHERRSMVVGIVCMVFNIMMYASPLSVMKLVITTKSVEYMPFFLSLASFANGLCWTAYALIRFDLFIAATSYGWRGFLYPPISFFYMVFYTLIHHVNMDFSDHWGFQASNGLGSLFGLAQLILYATYYKSTKRHMAARKLREMSLSEVVVDNGGDEDSKKTNGTAPQTEIRRA